MRIIPENMIVVIGEPDVLPTPQLPKLNETLPRDVIAYKGRIFEVPPEMMDYFSSLPKALPLRIQRAYNKGMGFMYNDGGYGCHYCNHYADNIAKLVGDNFKPAKTIETENGSVVIGEPIIRDSSDARKCRYEERSSARWARAVRNKAGTVCMAAKSPCAVEEAKIEIFAEQGLLAQYEVQGRNFDYPTLDQLSDPEILKRFTITQRNPEEQRPEKPRKGLLGKLGRLFDKLRGSPSSAE